MKPLTQNLISLAVFVASCVAIELVAKQRASLLETVTAYRLGSTEDSRGLRGEVWKWDFHFASEIQKKDEAKSLAFDGNNLHANTSHEALLYFTHRVHCLAWCVTNQEQAIEFTNIVERWITNMPTGPE